MRNYDGDFEVHVTVRAETPESFESFVKWCDRQQVKCIRILLARGDHVEQPMATWRRAATILPAVVDEANRMARDADHEGIVVTRVKVEAAPYNQEVPVLDDDTVGHEDQNYFEHHVKLRRETGQTETDLTRICLRHGAHLSRNAFRQSDDGTQERFVTLRSYGVGRETSEAKLKTLLNALDELHEIVIETESEYCVYDSNLALDDGWLVESS